MTIEPKPDRRPIKILVAPNAFKRALGAVEAAEAIAQGLSASNLNCICHCLPVSDGGDGLRIVLTRALGGEGRTATVQDPLGRPVEARFGWVAERRLAIVEFAEAAGLALLAHDERNPMIASSAGVGQLIAHAMDFGAREIIVGFGGSATIDGGFGMLASLGGVMRDASGREIAPMEGGWEDVADLDFKPFHRRMAGVSLKLLCDVSNPLLGPQGAARVFGRQKGAHPPQIAMLEHRLGRMVEHISSIVPAAIVRRIGAGAAGGAAVALAALARTELLRGIDYVLDAIDFDHMVRMSDLVITAEGGLDAQTADGKAPAGVAIRAKRFDRPIIALAGRVPGEYQSALDELFDGMFAIGSGPASTANALPRTGIDLERTAFMLGNVLALKDRLS